MPRGAQVIYPKDLGADLHPGRHRPRCPGVREWYRLGALSMTMLRYGAEIVGYEIREDFANRARKNVESFLGTRPSSGTTSTSPTATRGSTRPTARSIGSCSTFPSRGRSSRTPRGCCRPAVCSSRTRRRSRRPPQVRESLKGKWIDARTIEVLHRGWHIEGQAVRPDHRMVAHTGFLSVARFLGRNELTVSGLRGHEGGSIGRRVRPPGWSRSAAPRPSRRSFVPATGRPDGCCADRRSRRSRCVPARRRNVVAIVVEQREDRRHIVDEQLECERPTADGWSPRSSLLENSTRY